MKFIKYLRITAILLLLLCQKSFAQDLMITGVNSPISGCNISCTVPLSVNVYNNGSFIVSGNFDLSYSVNGGSAITESVFTPSFFPGGVYTYDFMVDPVICAAGTYNIDITVTLPGDVVPGNNTLSVTIINDTTVVPGTLTGSDTVCAGTNSGTLQLMGYTGYIGSWEYSTNSGATWNTIAGATTDTYSYSNLDTTTIFRVQIDGGYCADNTSPWVIIRVDEPSDGGFLVGATTVCSTGNTGDVDLTGYSGQITGWEYSTDGGGSFTPISNTTNQQTYTNLTQTTIYQAIVQNGVCPPDYSSPVTITVTDPGSAGTVSHDTTVCSGESGSLALIGYSGTIQFWLSSTTGGASWSPIANTTPLQTYTGITQTTVYTVIVKNGICPADTAISATVTVVPLPVAYAGVDDSVLVGDTLCLNAIGGFFYQWSPATFLTDPNIQNPCMQPTSIGPITYTVTVTDIAGCMSTDQVTILVEDSVRTPPVDTTTIIDLVVCNFMTPNNDGDNDVWNIIGIEQYPLNEVKIINNHGQIIFEETAYKNTWNGNEHPDGSYYYLVKVPELDKTFKGVLTITSSQ